MDKRELRNMSRQELEAEFEVRKAALIEVRDEIDRRDLWTVREGPDVDFTRYVED